MKERIEAYILRLVERSTPEKTAWNLEKIREGKPVTWNYIDGCMLTALLSLTEITGDGRYAAFAEQVTDHFVQENGEILTFDPEKRQLDDYNEGRVLFPAYRMTGKEKYRKAAEMLHRTLAQQPRTPEGSFWHKKIYPNQVWLDGIYMAQPFEALYQDHFGNGDVTDILRQIRTVKEKMQDPETGLYWQVVDQGGREGNYLESSGSSMIACGMLKGARLGILGKDYETKGRKTFQALTDRLTWKDGEPELGGICLVAGLGPENNRRRDGSFEYYISEPVVANDAKGVAPFVLCYTELLRAGK